ncbi:hypothetical protein HF1_03910 [Mycoplasma haemofelis str. Langford 1]|uniref:Uncharacterized protein n=1 Tax=Mycoplasma haemofelis (strain Langford 1) TaxID=941640 RepID=E8ZGX8_MYCHL|nr:hypothetical protein [Mycoplasma haemofelis]CBY92399.1 hypothetical protein HF1_03910 [Mycoplasma haemofelis str. Langford 1]
MSLTPAKMALGLGSASAVGTGSYFAVKHLQSQDVPKAKVKLSEQLLKDGFTLLNFESGDTHKSEWTTILSKYKEDAKDRLEGVSISSEGDHEAENINSLKSACKDLVGVEVASESYKKARRWCVVPKGVKESLVGQGRTIPNNEESKSDDRDFWVGKISSYDGQTLPLAGTDWSQTREEASKITAIKKGCKTLLEKGTKTHDSEFSSEYETAVKWCVS